MPDTDEDARFMGLIYILCICCIIFAIHILRA
jgi:hypothetical protein